MGGLIVLAVILILAYVIRRPEEPAPVRDGGWIAPADTAGGEAADAPSSTPGPKPRGGSPAAAERNFTIFIGTYRDSAVAARVAGRWTGAGYEAFVDRGTESHRVALGRYRTLEEAREEAEKLRHAFEEGYWVGQIGGAGR